MLDRIDALRSWDAVVVVLLDVVVENLVEEELFAVVVDFWEVVDLVLDFEVVVALELVFIELFVVVDF